MSVIVSISLPRPISTNTLFRNGRFGKGRVATAKYTAWKCHAHAMILKQKVPRSINYPVFIHFEVGEVGISAKFDGDNTLKCLQDALVDNGILQDDNRAIVKGVSMRWTPIIEGAVAHIFDEAQSADDVARIFEGQL